MRKPNCYVNIWSSGKVAIIGTKRYVDMFSCVPIHFIGGHLVTVLKLGIVVWHNLYFPLQTLVTVMC